MPGVDALHIRGRSGLGIAQSLGLLQRLVIAQPQPGHAVENVIAGAVHNAPHLADGLNPAGPLQFTEPTNAAAHCGGAAEFQPLFPGQRNQVVIEGGNQSLVGGDDVLSCLHGRPDELVGRMQTAHSLHHGVNGLILHDGLKIPGHPDIGKGRILQAADLSNFHILPGSDDLINAPAHNAEA